MGVTSNKGQAWLQPGAVVAGGLLAFAVTVLGSILVGIVVALSEWQGLAQGNWFHYAGIFIGAVYAGKRAGKAGFIQGGLVGLLYLLALMAIQLGGLNPQALLGQLEAQALAIAIVAGAVGGTIGVNL